VRGSPRSLVASAAKACSAPGALVALAALIAYCALASPHIVEGENAELAAVGAIGGRAHPPGYPLYVLWLRAWSWLPGTPAHATAFATAILGALALLVLHAACRAWGARPLAAAIAVVIVGAAPLFVRYHSQAEVFALNHLIAALVLWLAAAHGPLRGERRAIALGLVAGLGLANHFTCALLAPVGLLGAVRGVREARRGAVAAAGAIAALAVGLTPYAYLAVADGPASWGVVSSLDDLLTIVLRREYGGVAGFAPLGTSVPWTASLLALLETIARTWLWLPAVVAPIALGVRIWRPGDGEPRWGWIALAISVVLAGPLLVTRFNVEPEGLGLYICQRFHLLPALLLAIPVAAALDVPAASVKRPVLAAALPLVVFAGLVVVALPSIARLHTPAVELGVRNLLRSLPHDAVVHVVPDDLCGGSIYLQEARRERPDVVVMCAAMLRLPWYRTQLSRRTMGVDAVPGGLSEALVRSGRPVFVDPQLTNALAAYPNYPHGVVRRVQPLGTPVPPPVEVAALNKKLFAAFDLDYPWPGPADEYAALAHYRYAGAWSAIARLLAAVGDRAAAQDAMELSAQLTPKD
jgi:hypothetical protein